ncbi:MAG: hypothetical protein AABZ53_03775 [Planctomycetota bacterium]
MARGRKRLIAGWGLIAFGLAVTGAMVASRWFVAGTSLGPSWFVLAGAGFVTVSRENKPYGVLTGGQLFFRLYRPELVWTLPIADEGWDSVIYLWVVDLNRLSLPNRPTVWRVGFMLWPIILASFAAGTPILTIARRIRRRARLGQCVACGYALTGLAPGAPCPECGKRER